MSKQAKSFRETQQVAEDLTESMRGKEKMFRDIENLLERLAKLTRKGGVYYKMASEYDKGIGKDVEELNHHVIEAQDAHDAIVMYSTKAEEAYWAKK